MTLKRIRVFKLVCICKAHLFCPPYCFMCELGCSNQVNARPRPVLICMRSHLTPRPLSSDEPLLLCALPRKKKTGNEEKRSEQGDAEDSLARWVLVINYLFIFLQTATFICFFVVSVSVILYAFWMEEIQWKKIPKWTRHKFRGSSGPDAQI